MEKMLQESDTKSGLVSKICSISTAHVVCIHKNVGSGFIDWYRILEIEENAGVDLIRKRYHKLALQIHPDKNNHPKAEIAFKLISQAYTCLSDESKRRSFNSDRHKNFCRNCNRIPYETSDTQSWTKMNLSRSFTVSRNLKDIRDRFREENKVIESCLRANYYNCSGNEYPVFNPSGKDSAVFDPSDYVSRGYPHVRNRVLGRSNGFWDVKQTAKNMNDFPVFENGSDWRMFRSKSTCVRS